MFKDINKLFWAFRGLRYKLIFGRFGNLSYIGKPISIIGKRNIFIGNRVRIYPGIRMEAANGGSITIEDNTAIAQNFHITSDAENLIIGSNSTILGNVCITNIDHDYHDIKKHVLEQKRIIRTTRIGENCFIGFGSVILAGSTLGNNCVVGANSVVRGNFPDYCVIVGAPAKVVKRYNPVSNEWERTERE